MLAQILHDLSYFSSALNCDWILAVELRVVPVHLGESKNLLANDSGRFIRLNNSDLDRLRDIVLQRKIGLLRKIDSYWET